MASANPLPQGPKPRDTRRQIMEQISTFYAAKTDDRGHVNRLDVRRGLLVWLLNHTELLELGRYADSLLDNYEKARKPRTDSLQPSLFMPDCLLVIGDNQRVQMEDATRDDFVTWYQLEKAEHQAQRAAWDRKQDYHDSRLAAWRNEYATLGDLERAVFGWVPSDGVGFDDPSDDTADDD